MRNKLIIVLTFLYPQIVDAQIGVTEQQVLDFIIKNHPSMQISDLKVQRGKAEEKAAINIPNPEIVAESPSATFYTIGVLQQLEFPSVSFRQHRRLRLA